MRMLRKASEVVYTVFELTWKIKEFWLSVTLPARVPMYSVNLASDI